MAEVIFMSRRKKPFPHDATPDVHAFPAPPESAESIVNRYGTYNIQPTVDTTNTFPLIGQGLPKQWRDMHLDRDALEKEE